jgi:hypothetical protein
VPRGRRSNTEEDLEKQRAVLAELERELTGYSAQQAPRKEPPATAPQPPAGGPVLHLNVPLIETAEPHLLAEVRADSKTGKHMGGVLTPCACLINGGEVEVLIRDLLKAGHTPKVAES